MNPERKSPKSLSSSKESTSADPQSLASKKKFVTWSSLQSEIAAGTLPLVDVRSAKEFALGSIPGAINIPVLNNEERHQVGLTYKTVGRSEAVALGLELLAARVELFIQDFYDLCPHEPRKLVVYCWRGGMRSQMVAAILAVAGFDPHIITNGYKGFRCEVLRLIEQLALHRKVVLHGRTGVGKTRLIQHLIAEGLPVLDFEGIAHHRGSAFGGMAQKLPCPTQQNFENKLINAYLPFATKKTILVEIESFIGPVKLPKILRDSLVVSSMILLERDFTERVDLIVCEYFQEWDKEKEQEFCNNLEMLRKFLPRAQYEGILKDLRAGAFAAVVSSLLQLRYDRSYDRGIAKHKERFIGTFNLSAGEEGALRYFREVLR